MEEAKQTENTQYTKTHNTINNKYEQTKKRKPTQKKRNKRKYTNNQINKHKETTGKYKTQKETKGTQ